MPTNDRTPQAYLSVGTPLHRFRGEPLFSVGEVEITGPLDWKRATCLYAGLHAFGATLGGDPASVLAAFELGIEFSVDVTEDDRMRVSADAPFTVTFANPALWGFAAAENVAALDSTGAYSVTGTVDYSYAITFAREYRFEVTTGAGDAEWFPGVTAPAINAPMRLLTAVRAREGSPDAFRVVDRGASLCATADAVLSGANRFHMDYDPAADRVYVAHSNGADWQFAFESSELAALLGFRSLTPDWEVTGTGRVWMADDPPRGVFHCLDGLTFAQLASVTARHVALSDGTIVQGWGQSRQAFEITFESEAYWSDTQAENRLAVFGEMFEGIFTAYQSHHELRRIGERYSLSTTPEIARKIGALPLAVVSESSGFRMSRAAPNFLDPITITGQWIR